MFWTRSVIDGVDAHNLVSTWEIKTIFGRWRLLQNCLRVAIGGVEEFLVMGAIDGIEADNFRTTWETKTIFWKWRLL